MAAVSASATSLLPSLLQLDGKNILPVNNHIGIPKKSFSFPSAIKRSVTDRQRLHVITKAAGESSDDSSTNIVKYIKDSWGDSEDRYALVGLGFAGIAGFWALTKFFGTIDKLPLIPSVMEFVGIAFSSWFIYNCLLFKPDREKLVTNVKKSFADVFGK
ncbi:Protein CURVATURE THYLAKOID 1C, chloroplastic [Zostera marina]|uniref:Protein CURVATURE THYLAKOID 1C, chloroplastic n=1 Tax=Zostera marina TaxID=29655 RepID=A0A0K9PBJ7_ZOSMR|nr:Protein CURVATURE THYLAKOID 1C, chloroplastic [Zostera marina]